MCIRDRYGTTVLQADNMGMYSPQGRALLMQGGAQTVVYACLLYTSDAADERSSVDLGGCRIIKKKYTNNSRRSLRDN